MGLSRLAPAGRPAPPAPQHGAWPEESPRRVVEGVYSWMLSVGKLNTTEKVTDTRTQNTEGEGRLHFGSEKTRNTVT